MRAIVRYKVVTQMGNRPIRAQGMQRPTETPPMPDGLDWDLWIGPAPMRPYHPTYHPTAWRAWWDFGCGALGDMACHVMDAAYQVLKLGYPTSVTTHMAYNVVREQDRPLGQPREVRRQLPARDARALHVPGPRKEPAGREAALVRRRPAAGAARGARAASSGCPRAGRSSSARRASSCARPTPRARA